MKKFVFSLSVLFAMNLSLSAQAEGLAFSAMSLPQGFNFSPTAQTTFGHMVEFQIGSTKLPSDLTVVHPVTKQKIRVAGVISAYSWSAALKDPMKFVFNVSKENAKKIEALMKQPQNISSVNFNFQIYQYDQKKNAYFIAAKSFTMPKRGILNEVGHTLPNLKNDSLLMHGMVTKNGADPILVVDKAPGKEVPNPANVGIQVSISPVGKKPQDVVYATSSEATSKVSWGFKY